MKFLGTLFKLINQMGINPILTVRFLKGLPKVIKDYFKFKKLNDNKLFPLKNIFFITSDLYEQGGTANGHYFHQDLLIAQKIFKSDPNRHIDIGSRVDGLIGHIACFRKIEVFDIREIKSEVDNIIFTKADLMNLDERYINCSDSVSSLHAIEHFGLGRYGDPIDINGHLKGLSNIYKILKKGGKLYFSVPVGEQRIEFNAHRVFNIKYLLDYFENKYTLISFSFVDDKGDLHKDVKVNSIDIENNYGCHYGCGIFELLKK